MYRNYEANPRYRPVNIDTTRLGQCRDFLKKNPQLEVMGGQYAIAAAKN